MPLKANLPTEVDILSSRQYLSPKPYCSPPYRLHIKMGVLNSLHASCSDHRIDSERT